VLKTLTPAAAHDEQERAGLAHEEWLTKRANARYFAQPFVMPATRRSAFYIVSTWHAGHTLGQALKRDQHFTIPEVIKHASWLARAVGALHRRSIIHRDIKPDNIHFGDDGEGRLLDLGVALSGFEPASSATGIVGNAGTPTYIAPEQYEGTAPSNRSDIFALGITLYEMLTRKFPYGEIEPFQRPRFGEPVPPSRYRPDLPTWLERVILKAVAKQPEDRFETAEELLLWLERGATQPLERQATASLIERGSLAAWRAVALGSILINALLLLWMIFKK
jgi:serine/threonine protein kinase